MERAYLGRLVCVASNQEAEGPTGTNTSAVPGYELDASAAAWFYAQRRAVRWIAVPQPGQADRASFRFTGHDHRVPNRSARSKALVPGAETPVSTSANEHPLTQMAALSADFPA